MCSLFGFAWIRVILRICSVGGFEAAPYRCKSISPFLIIIVIAMRLPELICAKGAFLSSREMTNAFEAVHVNRATHLSHTQKCCTTRARVNNETDTRFIVGHNKICFQTK